MGPEVEIMLYIMLGFLLASIVCTVGLPVLYAFSPWKSTILGKLIMVQYVSYALFLIAILVFALTPRDPILVVLIVEAFTLMSISVTSCFLAVKIWQFNFSKKRKYTRSKDNPNNTHRG